MTRSVRNKFGWSATKLADHYSLKELAEMRDEIVSDPANAATDDGLWLYTPDANKKLDALSWAVRYVMEKGGR